ncbi:hypothetical protein AYR62_00980 [Secundilactobacillus paracollinoides]|uniref:DUF2922 domain-containing protein n=1 Tax=Secundilactobacillus paracollinoides TaxID=240427 RepID=A0A1B2IVH8_9LACO|nr:DUF2922 domain-containing protein [Secundilactobacillus paracollinoides]ANZ60233.1 hypothetical protein AYR61_01940 [Secundilactobacillus paracollinoides]ANZ62812.1 hypothetical protein AYR62_00980 [Secundilactobacillus paracollinoides]ANZ66028.1 hypothetical protein AYR63_01960 [Secundilactobacillus paracollinoides]KRL76748.1 hypothetical protein FC17_GL001643 [Secundilactobacillus paracollinoides DSM 15502 = JCM 11969]
MAKNSSKSVLQLIFKGEDEKLHTFSFNKAVPDLDEATVNKAMATVTSLDMFQKDGVQLYLNVISAAYVDTVTRGLFEV